VRLPWRRAGGDPDAELRFWLEDWDPVIRAGGYHPGDVEAIIGEPPAADYETRRRQIARATVARVEREAGLAPEIWRDKVVVDIGCGPLGFPDACPARVSIGVEPLAGRFAAHGLLLDGPGLYLPVAAEAMPLVDATVDVVVARNSLDHVTDPGAVVAEAHRVLRPGGLLVVNVDIDSPPTAAEPHTFSEGDLRELLRALELRDLRPAEAHGVEGRALVAVAVKRG
jgi:SAM-dependent methyltransferase